LVFNLYCFKTFVIRWVWCYTPVIPAPGKWRQEEHNLKASLHYIARDPASKDRKRPSVMAHAYYPSYLGKVEIGRVTV
jgi:hypothetical protein